MLDLKAKARYILTANQKIKEAFAMKNHLKSAFLSAFLIFGLSAAAEIISPLACPANLALAAAIHSHEHVYTLCGPGIYGATHPNGGGYVAATAFVAKTAFVGPDAAVCGMARVTGHARIFGSAMVLQKARVWGHAKVSGNAMIAGHALVSGHAQVKGKARISGTARVTGNAIVLKANLKSGKITSGEH